jgi:predicted nucleic acid-binding protein
VAKYVIALDVALNLAAERAEINDEHRLLAPTLLRSQMLATLYGAVQRGEITRKEADSRLDYVRKLRLGLLGDRMLQKTAWRIAADLGWSTTLDAEYVALTTLQADALVTLDDELASAVAGVVEVVPAGVLL